MVCGAGISTKVIPDFRSNNGLYNKDFVRRSLKNPQEELFSLETFIGHTELMTKLIQIFFDHEAQTPHKFLKEIEDKILHIYTQNIDGLEEKAGIERSKITYVHGSLTNHWTFLGCNRNCAYKADHKCPLAECEVILRVK